MSVESCLHNTAWRGLETARGCKRPQWTQRETEAERPRTGKGLLAEAWEWGGRVHPVQVPPLSYFFHHFVCKGL